MPYMRLTKLLCRHQRTEVLNGTPASLAGLARTCVLGFESIHTDLALVVGLRSKSRMATPS
eukprot:scaffold199763_cov38-Prasinocladus_malaysianus.AAC.1